MFVSVVLTILLVRFALVQAGPMPLPPAPSVAYIEDNRKFDIATGDGINSAGKASCDVEASSGGYFQQDTSPDTNSLDIAARHAPDAQETKYDGQTVIKGSPSTPDTKTAPASEETETVYTVVHTIVHSTANSAAKITHPLTTVAPTTIVSPTTPNSIITPILTSSAAIATTPIISKSGRVTIWISGFTSLGGANATIADGSPTSSAIPTSASNAGSTLKIDAFVFHAGATLVVATVMFAAVL